MLKSGFQWNWLPQEFFSGRRIYDYFKLWKAKSYSNKPSLLEQALKNVVGAVRISNGRSETTTFLIVDTQSVKKNTGTSEHKGYGAGKEISGIKRHIAVDKRDFPDAIAVPTAGVTDRKGYWKLLPIKRNSCRRGGQSSGRWRLYGDSLLQTALLKYLEQRLKLPSVMSFTLLK